MLPNEGTTCTATTSKPGEDSAASTACQNVAQTEANGQCNEAAGETCQGTMTVAAGRGTTFCNLEGICAGMIGSID